MKKILFGLMVIVIIFSCNNKDNGNSKKGFYREKFNAYFDSFNCAFKCGKPIMAFSDSIDRYYGLLYPNGNLYKKEEEEKCNCK